MPINPSIDTAICECGDECDVAPNLKLLSHWSSSAAPMHITQIHTVSVNIRYEVNIVNVVHCRDIEAILSVLVCWYGKVDIVNIVGILRRYYQQEQLGVLSCDKLRLLIASARPFHLPQCHITCCHPHDHQYLK